MPWNRNDPDPLEDQRRQLAEKQRLVAEEIARLTKKLQEAGVPTPVAVKPAEPPVWRLEDDGLAPRPSEPTPARQRHLARQRRRDRMVFFIFIALFIVVVVIVVSVWIASAHNPPVNPGA